MSLKPVAAAVLIQHGPLILQRQPEVSEARA
jgi:hypothetical protein